MSQGKRTTSHNTIRKWVEERGGRPATVEATQQDDEAGILRIDFPSDGMDPGLTEISWQEFFRKFDASDLEFLYQDETSEGQTSRFCKLVRKPK